MLLVIQIFLVIPALLLLYLIYISSCAHAWTRIPPFVTLLLIPWRIGGSSTIPSWAKVLRWIDLKVDLLSAPLLLQLPLCLDNRLRHLIVDHLVVAVRQLVLVLDIHHSVVCSRVQRKWSTAAMWLKSTALMQFLLAPTRMQISLLILCVLRILLELSRWILPTISSCWLQLELLVVHLF